MTSLLSVPLVIVKMNHPELEKLVEYASIFMLSLFSLIIFFWVSRTNRDTGPVFPRFLKFLITFPVFLAFSMGLSLHNTIATMEGYLGIKSPFIRTPKLNISGDNKDNWKTRTKYFSRKISPVTFLEGFLALFFISAFAMDIYFAEFALLPFHFLLLLGYSSIFYFSIQHSFSAPA
jgi:hypothetical protein